MKKNDKRRRAMAGLDIMCVVLTISSGVSQFLESRSSGMDWLRDAGYAVMVLLLAVTFPMWAVPYWIGKKKKGE